MSMRSSDLGRWPLPPTNSSREKVRLCLPHSQTWPVMPIHNQWMMSVADEYGFDGSVDEVLRHLIYVANSEPKAIKKLIFRTIRCLHCHVGARADQHSKVLLGSPKKDTAISIHTFHYEWLVRVTKSCNIASVEKCVRIILDYYQSRVQQVLHEEGPSASKKKELELFGRNRQEDPRFRALSPPSPTNDDSILPPLDDDLFRKDPAACSPEETLLAIQRCQVGRNSASYALARKETPQETQARRSKEILLENSEDTKRAREQIRKALGSPMG